MALKAGTFSPPRFYDFAPDAVAAVRLRHVQVDTEALATAVVGLVKAGGQSLADLAASLSTDVASRAAGGDLGWWDPHRGEPADPAAPWTGGDMPTPPPAALLAAATRVRPNTLQVVDSPAGWHVFVVEDARHALRPTLTLPPRAPNAFRHKAAVKGGLRRSANLTRGAPPPSPPTPMSYHIITLGCAMNEADSERMAAELERVGYSPVEDAQTAAVVVWNTCSIRDHAEQKVYSALGRHAARKWAAMGDVTLVVAGCVAQQEGAALLRRVPEVDLVLGPQYANRLGELLDDVRTNGSQVVATEPMHVSEDLTKPRRGSSITAWVNVIYGCLERCTYCVVPNVRGLEQSRPISAIRAEIEALAAQGVVEIVLLGQNVDAYGRDLVPRTNLTALFEAIADVPGILRYRFTTSHPRYMTERLIRTVAALPTFANHIHLPFQSGDNTVLQRMSRGYTVERYERIVSTIREVMPDASVTADAIVAFPGETEAQFQNTLDLMSRLTLDTVNTAAYSPRPNTPAGAWEDQLPESVKEDRLARINRQVVSDALAASQRRIGTVSEVLVEGPNPQAPDTEVYGRNSQNRMVYFVGSAAEYVGRIVRVLITEATAFSLRGERVCDE
ncbi:hypothetical protein MMPV_006506 [Pyropia vietnamensis]